MRFGQTTINGRTPRLLLPVAMLAMFLATTGAQPTRAQCDNGYNCCNLCPPQQITLNVSLCGVSSGGAGIFNIEVIGEAFDFLSQGVGLEVWTFPQPYAPRTVISLRPGTESPETLCQWIEAEVTDTIGGPNVDSIGFWTKIWQEHYHGGPIYNCVHTSDTVWFTLPATVEDTTPGIRPLPGELGPPQCEASLGDPIDAVSGNLYLSHNDVSIGTVRGMPIQFYRSYNSGGNSNGTLGRRWTHSYDYSLEVSGKGHVTLKEGTGRELTFLLFNVMDSIWYMPPAGINCCLEHDTTSGLYSLYDDDDIEYAFDSANKLDYLADRTGNRIELSYSDSLLTGIEDASGRELSLHYASGLLTRIESESGDTLADFDYVSGTLDKVTYGDGSWIDYDYQGRSPATMVLRQVSNSDGGVQYYTIDSLDRTEECRSTDSVNQLEMEYLVDNTDCLLSGHRFETTRSGDSSAVYESRYVAGTQRRFLTQAERADCLGCGVSFDYDATGNRVKVTYENNVADWFAYDERGNIPARVMGVNTSL